SAANLGCQLALPGNTRSRQKRKGPRPDRSRQVLQEPIQRAASRPRKQLPSRSRLQRSVTKQSANVISTPCALRNPKPNLGHGQAARKCADTLTDLTRHSTPRSLTGLLSRCTLPFAGGDDMAVRALLHYALEVPDQTVGEK